MTAILLNDGEIAAASSEKAAGISTRGAGHKINGLAAKN